jgi:hypothetical protein
MPKLRRDLLKADPPDPRLQACVILPIRNEQELLAEALFPLANQRTEAGAKLPYADYEVLALINNSSDTSIQIAREFARRHPEFRLHIFERQLPDRYAHIGYVRRLLMDSACSRLIDMRPHGAILSTDADTRVAPNWIAVNLSELHRGADAVGGRIFTRADERAPLDRGIACMQRLDQSYRRLVSWIESRFDPEPYDPWPRHHQHFGSSLAITADAYATVGGVPPRRYFEDLALYSALRRRDFRIRHSLRVRVQTSARLDGRTKFGWSRTLAEWQQAGKAASRIKVESRRFLEFMFETRRMLRQAWERKRLGHDDVLITALCSRFRCSYAEVADPIADNRYFGELLDAARFYERCRTAWPEWERLQPLEDAVQEMLTLYRTLARTRTTRLTLMPYAANKISANGHSRSTHVASVENPA